MRRTIIDVMAPDGTEAEYDSFITFAEDIVARETRENRVSNEVLDQFRRVFRDVDFNLQYGIDTIVTIFASCLGYDVVTKRVVR